MYANTSYDWTDWTNDEYSTTFASYDENVTLLELHQDVLTYSVVGFHVRLERNFFKHILSYYFPSLLFVLVSWISFVIPPDVIPGRMGMLIVVLLVQVNLFGTVLGTQPPTKYPTSLEIWIIICIMFVMGTLFAYAALLFKKKARFSTLNAGSFVTTVKPISPPISPNLNSPNVNQAILNTDRLFDEQNSEMENALEMRQQFADWDSKCLMVFPAAFIGFNLIYWPSVLMIRHSQ